MDIERGTTSTYVVAARQKTGETHYLFVFEKIDDPTFFQYSITTNTGGDGVLFLEIEERDSATATNGEATLGAGDWRVHIYAQASSSNLDPSSSTRKVHTELIRVYSASADDPVYPPAPSGDCDDATVTINGTEVATPASGATANIPVVDQDGNTVGSWNGTQWVVNTTGDMAAIITHDNQTAALADTTSVTETQLVRLRDTNTLIPCDDGKTVAQVVQEWIDGTRESFRTSTVKLTSDTDYLYAEDDIKTSKHERLS